MCPNTLEANTSTACGFPCLPGCPTFRELLTDDTLALIAGSSPRLQSVRCGTKPCPEQLLWCICTRCS